MKITAGNTCGRSKSQQPWLYLHHQSEKLGADSKIGEDEKSFGRWRTLSASLNGRRVRPPGKAGDISNSDRSFDLSADP